MPRGDLTRPQVQGFIRERAGWTEAIGAGGVNQESRSGGRESVFGKARERSRCGGGPLPVDIIYLWGEREKLEFDFCFQHFLAV